MKEAYDCGLIIKELREKANMTQQELGRKINRDKGIISRYENNYQPVPFETMRTFAAIFNVSMDYLAGMEKSKTLSLNGLTEEQTGIITNLAELFCKHNIHKVSKMSPEQCEIIGQIVENFIKSN